ncbi:hypothetical protein SAMN04487972_12148 [Paracoccus halophilus]|uniref:Uncharacterized protein n=1 Tax=Paracoccus halophilus TaxID=376733 RepID=A0A1I0U620_9RHOB|nr:hypothetical protein [Paracoccus halophilus]SFA58646.1 hypothetical protein SAMN04487972_12148 [Paracoccus halophilus]
MSAQKDSSPSMTLLAYELLADHGLALPLFGSSVSANALHVAVPSRPGDPTTDIHDFEVYSATSPITLDVSLHRIATIGTVWVDVFVWDDVVHVGTRAELWESTEPEHGEMERTAPLTLFSLAEGASRGEAARCAALVHEWLERSWGAKRADNWRLNSYLTRVARRDLARHFREPSMAAKAHAILRKMLLVQRKSVLELKAPSVAEFAADDLPDLAFAVEELGWRLEVILDSVSQAAASESDIKPSHVMVMRLRHGRGRTQTQIPLRVFDGFFGGERDLRDAKTGRTRTMTLSMADGVRNTMKLQLPEIAKMSDPVARFERFPDSIAFEVYDSSSVNGRRIANLLEEGLHDGSTLKTQGGATWWRLLQP